VRFGAQRRDGHAHTAEGGRVMSVKVILRADLQGLGKRGDIVDVSDGYARNYLLPNGHAFKATDGAVSQAGAMRRARDQRDAHDREGAQAIATTLVAKIITIPAKAGPDGKLYGSVTPSDVVEAIAEQTNISLDRKQLHMDPIKSLGEHSVSAKLHTAVEFPIRVEVVKR
jgi:large subunit ribosomal protein L9